VINGERQVSERRSPRLGEHDGEIG
jgi:hypothetical protein